MVLIPPPPPPRRREWESDAQFYRRLERQRILDRERRNRETDQAAAVWSTLFILAIFGAVAYMIAR